MCNWKFSMTGTKFYSGTQNSIFEVKLEIIFFKKERKCQKYHYPHNKHEWINNKRFFCNHNIKYLYFDSNLKVFSSISAEETKWEKDVKMKIINLIKLDNWHVWLLDKQFIISLNRFYCSFHFSSIHSKIFKSWRWMQTTAT